MAGRTDEITEDVKAIVRTRADISEKVQALECGIRSTVEQTKEGVQQVVQHARNTAVEFAQDTKRAIDPVYQVRQHPLIMIGAVIALGYVFGAVAGDPLSRSRGSIRSRTVTPDIRRRLSDAQEEMLDDVIPVVHEELRQFRQRFLTVAKTFLNKMARQAVWTLTEPLEAALSQERPITGRLNPRDVPR